MVRYSITNGTHYTLLGLAARECLWQLRGYEAHHRLLHHLFMFRHLRNTITKQVLDGINLPYKYTLATFFQYLLLPLLSIISRATSIHNPFVRRTGNVAHQANHNPIYPPGHPDRTKPTLILWIVLHAFANFLWNRVATSVRLSKSIFVSAYNL